MVAPDEEPDKEVCPVLIPSDAQHPGSFVHIGPIFLTEVDFWIVTLSTQEVLLSPSSSSFRAILSFHSTVNDVNISLCDGQMDAAPESCQLCQSLVSLPKQHWGYGLSYMRFMVSRKCAFKTFLVWSHSVCCLMWAGQWCLWCPFSACDAIPAMCGTESLPYLIPRHTFNPFLIDSNILNPPLEMRIWSSNSNVLELLKIATLPSAW